MIYIGIFFVICFIGVCLEPSEKDPDCNICKDKGEFETGIMPGGIETEWVKCECKDGEKETNEK